jgi:ornithine carbamoyltransferase
VNLDPGELQLSRGETLADTARVLSRYLDGILIRTFAQEEVEELALHSSIPVINGLTDAVHPTQVLADLLTIREEFGRLEGVILAYVGDGNNVAHSLLQAAGKLGMHFRGAFPPGYEPWPTYVEEARVSARRSGGSVTLTSSPQEAVEGAHAVYTDVWASMGQEKEREERLTAFRGFQVTPELLRLAHPEAIFLHCLPAHREEEVSSEVLDGPRSRVWEQAENRLHIFKGILLWVSKNINLIFSHASGE